jgi:16S rRNA (adenine1518-N6/adenine1519-N6)-dimethyltransferase
MKLSEMKQVLAAGEIQLTKSLGQNFLHDANQLRRIVELAEVGPRDKVLEIGPGLGPLTELLVRQAGEVLAIEKDARLVQILREHFRIDQPRSASDGSTHQSPAVLQLVQDDALEYLRREKRDWRDWKLVANLPYSVASPILVELAQNGEGPARMVATLQLEVARRLSAQPNDEAYGLLSLLVQLDYEPRTWFKISASCFFPKPDVDSACVCLLRRPVPLLAQEQRALFEKIVKLSFSQRRKMMLKLLKTEWPPEKLERAFESVAIPLDARAETLSLPQFVRLTQMLGASSDGKA